MRLAFTRLLVLSLTTVFFIGLASSTRAAPLSVSMATLGTAITQNFDTLATTGTPAWADDSTLTGWYAQFAGNATFPTTYSPSTGTGTSGAIYSFGVAGTNPVTERALGSVSSGNVNVGTIYTAFKLTNDTGQTITSLAISFNGEQWRNGGNLTAHKLDFQYQVADAATITDANTPTTGWTNFDTLDFTGPIATATAAALDGNAAANRVALSDTLPVTVNAGQEVWLRWMDVDNTGSDHGLAIDDVSVTPYGALSLSVDDVAQSEGDVGTTNFDFTVSLSSPAPAGGVTFDITTQDNSATTADNDYQTNSLTSQSIAQGDSTYTFTVVVNGDTTFEPDETFDVIVSNVSGANLGDGQGVGTIQNDEAAKIHDVQGNGAASPVAGSSVVVEGIVVGDYQGVSQLEGFFLQEEDADVDADPNTSEGIFVYCATCPTAVAEGQRVQVTGVVSEFNNMTEITATTGGSVVVTDSGNNLAQVTAASIDLPIVGVIDDYYEAREGMRVTFVDTLTVSEYFELARYGQIVLMEGGRPFQFTETNAPNAANYTAHLDDVARRKVILDDDNNAQQAFLSSADGFQAIYHPQANGGFSVGTQGTDFFRGGDLVNGLTGVLHWSFPGSGANTWRIRPTNANPVSFTTNNARPAVPPAVSGAIKAASMNLLNYFTTIDTSASGSSGSCGPSATLDCRGADSVAELNRQRERTSIVICDLNADVYAFMELENSSPYTTVINDLLGAVNARCGGANPYAFVDTGGTLGADAIRVAMIYRTNVLAPVGSPLVDLDPIHNRPPTAQTFDVVDVNNDAYGERFTVIANHFKSKGCPGTGADADQGDGQSCFNATRTAQAARLLTWINGTVVPAASDSDVLLLGDFNSYALEDPIAALEGGGYTNLETALLGAGDYSYLFDGQLGHLDYAFASGTLDPKVLGIGVWHINADEVPVFDYNDEIADSPGEAPFEEKPDGSALVPPRVVFQPASPYRASDHDPVLIGLFAAATQSGPNFVVNSAADTDDTACDLLGMGIGNKDCTLREAINAANTLAGADTITFDIPDDVGALCSAANVCTITLSALGSLPAINGNVTIDGSANSADITVNGADTYRVLMVNSGIVFTLNSLTITHGSTIANGGGLDNEGGTVTVTKSTFSFNSATSGSGLGGAIYNTSTLNIFDSTFHNNTSPTYGAGAIDNAGGTVNISNSTFNQNHGDSGGTIANNGTLNVWNSTVSGNNFGISSSGAATLKNTIIANNTDDDCGGSISADAYNIDSDGTCDNATQKTSAEIGLQALDDNGGPTETMALGNSSVAIDAGDDSVCDDNPGPNNLDQRGEARNDLQCDVGAFEFVQSDGDTVFKDFATGISSFTFGPTLADMLVNAGSPMTLAVKRELIAPNPAPNLPAGALPNTWDASTKESQFSLRVTLCYDPVTYPIDPTTLHVWHYNNITPLWDDLGGTSDTSHAPYACVKANRNLTALSPLALAPGGTTAENVNGVKAVINKKGSVVVKWKTTSESQIAGFNVYRRTRKGEWEQINANFMQAKYAGSVEGAKYRFADKTVKAGKKYRYKIEVIYLDNHSEWTQVVKVKTP